ncbi:LPXTG cell wall anchor domain-containing protein [Lacticaseibacillus camelliae]|uniref:Gram-positive cocci surface proteins LPxTG domain-containing protein n=1 Tax=Lacticaseibacillus camelliae DSM 22697 = JCM 13995 TaxID=1423730 RepID=A0A0R2F4Q3_9LACO|nr:LPXTG cell wall anchor domain-containing protein [Lacticaseibacillus camelliae]KRN22710.1 hypothetical protein FC75_GL001759 [Lacticaseibacillus camelliae DSM 22697 = JCM 13995]
MSKITPLRWLSTLAAAFILTGGQAVLAADKNPQTKDSNVGIVIVDDSDPQDPDPIDPDPVDPDPVDPDPVDPEDPDTPTDPQDQEENDSAAIVPPSQDDDTPSGGNAATTTDEEKQADSALPQAGSYSSIGLITAGLLVLGALSGVLFLDRKKG